MTNIRVGQGFDFHPFVEGRRLILGGVQIPHPRGLAGHSDADAVLHAITDAILGAAGLSDIGTYFPPSDDRWKDAAGLMLLEKAFGLVHGKGFRVVNVDLTVIAEEPRIGPHAEAMKANIARVLDVRPEDVGIKATTMEGKGPIGRREGLAVAAVALLERSE